VATIATECCGQRLRQPLKQNAESAQITVFQFFFFFLFPLTLFVLSPTLPTFSILSSYPPVTSSSLVLLQPATPTPGAVASDSYCTTFDDDDAFIDNLVSSLTPFVTPQPTPRRRHQRRYSGNQSTPSLASIGTPAQQRQKQIETHFDSMPTVSDRQLRWSASWFMQDFADVMQPHERVVMVCTSTTTVFSRLFTPFAIWAFMFMALRWWSGESLLLFPGVFGISLDSEATVFEQLGTILRTTAVWGVAVFGFFIANFAWRTCKPQLHSVDAVVTNHRIYTRRAGSLPCSSADIGVYSFGDIRTCRLKTPLLSCCRAGIVLTFAHDPSMTRGQAGVLGTSSSGLNLLAAGAASYESETYVRPVILYNFRRNIIQAYRAIDASREAFL
jgi:hypothetical protein